MNKWFFQIYLLDKYQKHKAPGEKSPSVIVILHAEWERFSYCNSELTAILTTETMHVLYTRVSRREALPHPSSLSLSVFITRCGMFA